MEKRNSLKQQNSERAIEKLDNPMNTDVSFVICIICDAVYTDQFVNNEYNYSIIISFKKY